MIRIAIDARAAAEVPAGRGRVVRELLAALSARDDEDVRYLLLARRPEPSLRLDARFGWRLLDAPDPLWHLQAARTPCDVLLSTNSYLTAWFAAAPTVVVVHDLIPFVPGTHPQRRAALIERATIARGVRNATRLVCNSEATRRDLLARHPDAAPRAVVVPFAASERFGTPADVVGARARHGLDRPYVLTTGTLEPRKNLPRLMEAWAGLPAALRDSHVLAVAGPRGWEMDALQSATAACGGGVRVLGHVPEDDLVALYQGATLFAFPSLYEGFGLPLLEAMRAGTPCLTSDVSSLPEVGGSAVAYADPRDAGAIRAALARLLTDPAERARLAEAGRARARRFTWARTAEGVLSALRAAARDPGTR